MDDFYETENEQISFNEYKTKIEERYQKIKTVINGITTKIKVAEIGAGSFVKTFPGVESLLYCDRELRADSIVSQYERDLSMSFCKKVEIIYKEE